MSKRFNSKSIIYVIAVVLLINVFSGCSKKDIENSKAGSTGSSKAGFSNIAPEEAKKRLDSEQGIILLDVRTKEEYAAGHIKDSILIPVDILEEASLEKLKDKDATIFVYCRSGNRSTTAANILVKQGYKNVYNLGGVNNWPYEVVK